MHIFLQGPKKIGKSTIIRKMLEILTADTNIKPGGFFTWNGGEADPHVYMRPACTGTENKTLRLASYDPESGLISDNQVFERDGVEILTGSKGANLIIMDELGFLESKAPLFRKAVLDILAGDIPVLGVLRLGGVPWHNDIKSNPQVTVIDVNENNRDELPRELAEKISTDHQGTQR